MRPEEVIEALQAYVAEFESMLSRFSKRGDALRMDKADIARARQIIQETVDLLEDVLGRNRYSLTIARTINEGTSNFAGTPSFASIRDTIAILQSSITRIRRNPAVIAGSTSSDSATRPIWALLHPTVVALGKSRFEAGHNADAVEAVLKELNTTVKLIYLTARGQELDGVPLMRKALTPTDPVILLDDLGTDTGRNIQQGHMDLFAGAMAGVRNPKAHGNVTITPERAIHHLFLASLLFSKLDERLEV